MRLDKMKRILKNTPEPIVKQIKKEMDEMDRVGKMAYEAVKHDDVGILTAWIDGYYKGKEEAQSKKSTRKNNLDNL